MSITFPGDLCSDIINWVRRIIKLPADQSISDDTIREYINRFYIYDMPSRLQQFDLKRQYVFETIPNVCQYQFPNTLYQMIRPPVYCDSVPMGYFQTIEQFNNVFSAFVSNQPVAVGDGTIGPFLFEITPNPYLRGFVDALNYLSPNVFITAIDNGDAQAYIVDNGSGILIQTDATFQTVLFPDAGTVDYVGGGVAFNFLNPIPPGNIISAQVIPYVPGTPRAMLFFDNYIKLFPVPNKVYMIQADVFVTPSQFLTTDAFVSFSYMSEYLARGAARKILSDFGDYDQFQFYEPLFREQEDNVIRRSSRQNATQRTPTIFSNINSGTAYGFGFTNY